MFRTITSSNLLLVINNICLSCYEQIIPTYFCLLLPPTIGLATKWLRILSLGGMDKTRNHLVVNPILSSRQFLLSYNTISYNTFFRNLITTPYLTIVGYLYLKTINILIIFIDMWHQFRIIVKPMRTAEWIIWSKKKIWNLHKNVLKRSFIYDKVTLKL